jgi:hypothetical protein
VTDTDTATVGVNNALPVFHDCPADVAVPNDAGLASAVVDWTPPTATDASGIPPLVTSTHAPGDTFPVGGTTVTYTATDAHGGESTCDFDVVVENTEPPTVTIRVPEDEGRYVVGAKVPAQWTATSLVGIQSVDATVASGELLNTSKPGCYVFDVSATDVTGLSSTRQVEWCAAYQMGPLGDTSEWPDAWLCIDHCLPPEERPLIGAVPLGGIYASADPVLVLFTLCDASGSPIKDCVCTLSVTRAQVADSGVAYKDLMDYFLRFHIFRYDEERAGYFFELQTWGYPPGYYDLWVTVNSVLYQRVRVQVTERAL